LRFFFRKNNNLYNMKGILQPFQKKTKPLLLLWECR
jgi:hypothetical protein